MQNIRMMAPTMACGRLNRACLTLLSGKTITFITSHTTTPYAMPTRNRFVESPFKYRKVRTKISVQMSAIR